jgi:zinc protease
MRIIVSYFFGVVCMCYATSVRAQKQTPPVGGTPKDFSLPTKKITDYANGLKTTTVQYGAIPKVNISIIKTGNIHEKENEVWLADFTGNLIKEGSTTSDFKAIAKKVAAMGGDINISTGLTQTSITGSVLSEYAPALIKIIADLVMNPAFPEKEVDRLKADLKRNLSVQRTQPNNLAHEKFSALMYGNHPYGRIFPTEAMIDNFTAQKARSFYEENFGARRSVLYVVGKFNEGDVNKAVKESLASWTGGPEVYFPPVEAEPIPEIAIIDRPGAPQTTIYLGMRTLDPSKNDYLGLMITNSLLGGSFGSRITSNIREDKGYTYSPYSTISSRVGAAYWAEVADVTTANTGDAIREISKEIARLQQEPPTEEELKGIQNYEAGVFVLRNSTPNGIIGQLNFLDLYGLDDSYLTDLVKNVHAVTPQQVQQWTKEYLPYEKMTLVMVGDKKELEKQIKSSQNNIKPK